jgi:hypothetical protein
VDIGTCTRASHSDVTSTLLGPTSSELFSGRTPQVPSIGIPCVKRWVGAACQNPMRRSCRIRNTCAMRQTAHINISPILTSSA